MGDAQDAIGEPLTKAKLFTTMRDDGSWTEMGVGVVSIIQKEATDADGGDGQSLLDEPSVESADGMGKPNGTAVPSESVRTAHLEMVALDDNTELLLSTPISLEDVYAVQHDAILVWSDAELGCEMACSFNSKEGCEYIYSQLTTYQEAKREELAKKAPVPSTLNAAKSADADIAALSAAGDAASGAKPPAVPVSGGTKGQTMSTNLARLWGVARENLPAIYLAVRSNQQRFGMYVRDHDTFFKELSHLFSQCKAESDSHGMEQIGNITVALLSTPYNTEGRIIAQFVDNDTVDSCVDIVQYALGRKSPETGFVSFEARRNTFRDPCRLPPVLLTKVHVLHSCLFLKDLLPLSLDDSDAAQSSMLSSFLMRFKLGIISDICLSETILPEAFRRCKATASETYELVRFLLDMSRSIKNGALPLELKEELYGMIVQAGAFNFLQHALYVALHDPRTLMDVDAGEGETDAGDARGDQTKEDMECMAQMCCDFVSQCTMLRPASRENLLAQISQQNGAGSVERRLSSPSLTPSMGRAAQSPLSKASSLSSPGNDEDEVPHGEDASSDVVRAAPASGVRDGGEPANSEVAPPLLALLMHCAADVPSRVGLQSAFYAITSCGTTLLPNVNPFMGAQSMAKRFDIIRYWIEGSVASNSGVPSYPMTSTSSPVFYVSQAIKTAADSLVAEFKPGNSLEIRVIYSLKTLSLIANEDNTNGTSMARVLVASKVIPALCSLVHCSRTQSRNLVSSVVSFFSALVKSGKSPLFDVLRGEGGPVDCAMALYLKVHRRNNMLCSSLLHMLSELCQTLHRQKIDSIARSLPVRSPFVQLLNGSDDDEVDGGRGDQERGRHDVVADATLVSYLLGKYGTQLRRVNPTLAERFQRVLEETPEEAQMADAESSSVASTIDRSFSARGDIDFEAMLMEFNTDNTPLARDGEGITSHLSDDDDPHDMILHEQARLDSSGDSDFNDPDSDTQDSESDSESDTHDTEEDEVEKESSERKLNELAATATRESTNDSDEAAPKDDKAEASVENSDDQSPRGTDSATVPDAEGAHEDSSSSAPVSVEEQVGRKRARQDEDSTFTARAESLDVNGTVGAAADDIPVDSAAERAGEANHEDHDNSCKKPRTESSIEAEPETRRSVDEDTQ